MGKTVWIRCKQVVEYSQQVTVTDEEWKILKEVDGWDIYPDDETREVYKIIDRKLNKSDITDAEEEYTDVSVTKS